MKAPVIIYAAFAVTLIATIVAKRVLGRIAYWAFASILTVASFCLGYFVIKSVGYGLFLTSCVGLAQLIGEAPSLREK